MDEAKSSSKVGVWGLVILIIITGLSLSVLPSFLPGYQSGQMGLSTFIPFGVIILSAFVVGIFVGKKTPEQKERLKLSLAIGIFTLIFVHFMVLPGSQTGLGSVFRYSMFLILPTVVGALIGGLLRK